MVFISCIKGISGSGKSTRAYLVIKFLREEWELGNHNYKILEIIKRCEEIIPKDFLSINQYMNKIKCYEE